MNCQERRIQALGGRSYIKVPSNLNDYNKTHTDNPIQNKNYSKVAN